jgi:phosphatidylserine/phosphatidylglycerophosphate/cardiolipin synthase-like enzyme
MSMKRAGRLPSAAQSSIADKMAVQSGKLGFHGKHFQVAGHDLHLVHQPQDRLNAVLQLIAAAQKSIHMFFYMFCADETGRQVRDALIAAATRGGNSRRARPIDYRQFWINAGEQSIFRRFA